ncbi:hypothetical protein ACLBXM_18235 [Xanthobacteraceae bacterium A53D]
MIVPGRACAGRPLQIQEMKRQAQWGRSSEAEDRSGADNGSEAQDSSEADDTLALITARRRL